MVEAIIAAVVVLACFLMHAIYRQLRLFGIVSKFELTQNQQRGWYCLCDAVSSRLRRKLTYAERAHLAARCALVDDELCLAAWEGRSSADSIMKQSQIEFDRMGLASMGIRLKSAEQLRAEFASGKLRAIKADVVPPQNSAAAAPQSTTPREAE